MKKTNKFLSILLATILILSLFPVTLAHASDNTITFSAETDKVDAKAGDIVNVDICMSENSVVAALTLVVNYDNTALKIVDVKSKEAFGYEEFNTAYGENQLAYLTASANPKTVGGTLFTVQFEVLKDGCTEVSLSVNELADIDLNPLSSSTQSAKIHNFVDGACTDCGEKSVKWSFDEATGTLTIYGTGPMEDCYDDGRPWESYKYDIKTVVIEDGITSIGYSAFYSCDNLTSVSIPNGVTSIHYNAFESCGNLISAIIPDSVTSIGNDAFFGCTSLEVLTIPDSVTSIGSDAFYNTAYYNDSSNWENNVLYIDNHLIKADRGISGDYVVKEDTITIAGYAFLSCEDLESVTIPDSVTSIEVGAFRDCEKLTSATIPDSVTSIESYAFSGCTSLESVTIGDSVTTIGQYAFTGCYSLKDITVDSDNQYYSSDEYGVLFNKDKTTLVQYPIGNTRTSYTIPDSVNTIGDYAFFECATLISVTIPDSVTSIGMKSSFQDCSSITSITIPDSVTTIGTFVFLGCDSLASVTIPDSVTSIGLGAFDSCRSIKDVYYSNTEEKWYDISIDSDNDPLLNARIHYNNTGADTHPYLPVVTPPTCTDQGFTTYTCACGYSYVEDYVDATGHNYNSVVTPPTCTEQGYTTYTCHCGDKYIDDYVDATGHSYTSEITTPATHTENGVMTYTCHCGDTYTETINATGDHYYVPTVTEPTCTEAGYTTYNCVCGDTYVDDETPANGHSFSNGNCTVCGEIDPDYYVFSVKEPSRTKIRNKDGIILHTEITGNAPAGSYVEWTSNNNNFNKTVMNDCASLRVIANNKGNTTFTATLYDANGNELATDSVELYSDSGFFQKIGGFFRSLFGATKIYEN